MNDPKVVALIYTVEPIEAGRYDKAGPLRYSGSPEFDLTVENKIARFEFKNFYADEDEAREAIKPFIEHWEFEASMQVGPGNFRLRFKEAEIIDRNPSPPEPGIRKLRASLRIPAPTITARISHSKAEYPPPPAGGAVNPNDPDVKSMYNRYVNYRSGGEFLPGMAYFCLTVLEYKFKGKNGKKARDEAAEKYSIHEDVLNEIGHSSAKGGPIGRKGGTVSLTEREERWLKDSVKKIIYRAAQVAADDSQRLPRITMADLPNL